MFYICKLKYESVNSVNSRITKLLSAMEVSPSQFADAIGVQRATISHILSGRNNPSLDFVQKVLARYPALNPDWILSGKGEMWRDNETKDNLIQPMAKKAIAQEPVHQTTLFDENKITGKTIVSNTALRNMDDIVAHGVSRDDTMIQPVKPDQKELSNSGIREKKVEKVIILYNDSTFEVYKEN